MTTIDQERIAVQVCKSMVGWERWRKERQRMLAEQLAANVEIKQRWMESDPIEVRQSPLSYNASAQVRALPSSSAK